MKAHGDARTTLAMNLDLGGRHAASARVELLEQPGDSRVARVALRGRIDRAAERRLERALVDLAPRRVSRVVLDCSDLRRLDGRQAERLAYVNGTAFTHGPVEEFAAELGFIVLRGFVGVAVAAEALDEFEDR